MVHLWSTLFLPLLSAVGACVLVLGVGRRLARWLSNCWTRLVTPYVDAEIRLAREWEAFLRGAPGDAIPVGNAAEFHEYWRMMRCEPPLSADERTIHLWAVRGG